MAALSEEELEQLFSGAPQFFSRSEGHHTGAPHASAAYPFDESLAIRDLTDHIRIEHPAWSASTAWPHIVASDSRGGSFSGGRRPAFSSLVAEQMATNGPSEQQPPSPQLTPLSAISTRSSLGGSEKPRAHFFLRCRERPSTLASLGIEKGTVGYQSAMELGVADALQENLFGFDTHGPPRARAIMDRRRRLLNAEDGIRPLSDHAILDRLVVCAERYVNMDLLPKQSVLYHELYPAVMPTPTETLDKHDPHGLAGQIQSLVRVLATDNVWVDFSHVEWRVQIGQILWGLEDDGDGVEEECTGDTAEDKPSPMLAAKIEERTWLLMQILLGCELQIRLDAITANEELGVESIPSSVVKKFEREATNAVKWSLLLARAWLENVDVVREIRSDPPSAPSTPPPMSGWLAAITSRMTLRRHKTVPDKFLYTLRGRHGDRQVDALMYFARKLRWPDVGRYEQRVTAGCLASTTDGDVGNSVPAVISTKVAEGMNKLAANGNKGPVSSAPLTVPSRRRKTTAMLHPAGWLSKAYIGGLVLPGDSLSFTLMSTLIENDPAAMTALADRAHLTSGFVYSGRSFWSTSCIVGRVLAAGRGATECMGWIASDITPKNIKEGWLNIVADEPESDLKQIGNKARVWQKKSVERDSYITGDADKAAVVPGNFTIATENVYETLPQSIQVELLSLQCISSMSKTPNSPSHLAALNFSITPTRDRATTESVTLCHDANFVTAQPCVPSTKVQLVFSPRSPTLREVDVSGRTSSGAGPTSQHGHPLHKFYSYSVIHISDLISRRDCSLDELLASSTRPPAPSVSAYSDKSPRVLVIDCMTNCKPRESMMPMSPLSPVTAAYATILPNMVPEARARMFGTDMEVLVRAICAEKGWNALISRRRRGCLSCAIREAGALAWQVVIRVE